MRLTSLIALSSVGLGFIALTACKGDDGPATEADTDTDTDTDADTDSDTDTDTGGGPAGPLGFIGYPGQGTRDAVAGTFVGTESLGIYQFTDQVAPSFDDFFALCEFTWDAVDRASYTDTPSNDFTFGAGVCAGCEFTLQLALSGGVETGPAAGCADAGVDATASHNTTYGYGHHENYVDSQGTAYGPSLMFYSTTNDNWGSPGPATYDAATGAWSYVFVDQIGYLAP